jgi:hypothetical protein
MMKKSLACLLFALTAASALAQGHDLKTPEALQKLAFMKGNWVGKQDFNTGGDPMVGDVTNMIEEVIGGHYFEEHLSTTLSGRKPTDTRHYITFDAKSQTFKAWWFNDTTVAPTEFEGNLTDKHLEMLSKPNANGVVMRVTYDAPADNKLTYKLEMKQGNDWQLLFTTTYARKSG